MMFQRTSNRRSDCPRCVGLRPNSSGIPSRAASRGRGPGCRSRAFRRTRDGGRTWGPRRRRRSGGRPAPCRGLAARTRHGRYRCHRIGPEEFPIRLACGCTLRGCGKLARERWRGGSYIAGNEVEVLLVKFECLGVVGRAHAEVTELMYRSWPLLEALELVDSSVFLRGLDSESLLANSTTLFQEMEACTPKQEERRELT